MSGTFRAELDGDIATLLIDNPAKRNAMSLSMYREVPAAVEAVRDARVVVLRGAGSTAFGAGSDISEFAERRTGDNAGHYNSVESEATDALASLPMPVIAAVHGPCRGGGAALALCADLRFAAADATFATPPARLGVGYPVDSVERLVAVVGAAAAKDLLLTARVVGAEEALSMGLVHRVVESDELDDLAAETAAQIASLAPLSLRAAKAAIDKAPDAVALTRACFRSADFAEGIASFAERRPPVFTGT